MENLNLEEYRGQGDGRKGSRANFHVTRWDGENNPHSFLTKETVQTIRELYQYNNKSKRELEQTFQLSRQHLNAILNNKIW